MNTIDIKAYLTNFELACEAGIIALVGDLIWLTHDIMSNGFSFTYTIIGILFVLGTALIVVAMRRHHKHYTHRLLTQTKLSKKKKK